MKKNAAADSGSRYLHSEIACRQVLQKQGSVWSEQWTVLPAAQAGTLTPAWLLERYLEHIRRFTLGLVRPRSTEAGVEMRCLGQALLSFRPPVLTENPPSLVLAIAGGLLVQAENCERGELVFTSDAVAEGQRVSLQLADFCPLLLGGPRPTLWRKLLYRLTQATIHRLVTVHFLVRLHRQLAGRRLCCRVVRVRSTDEENI